MRADFRHRLQLRIKNTFQRSLPRRWMEQRKQSFDGPDAIFIWIPKTGGTSLLQALARYGCRRFKSPLRARYHWNRRGFVTFGHQSVPALIDADILPQPFFQRAFRFSVVRHPQSRAISLYRYLQRKQVLPTSLEFSKFLDVLTENRPLPRLSPFERRWIETEGDSLRYHDGANPPPGCFNAIALSQCRPQTEWLYPDNISNPNPNNPAGWGIAEHIARIESLQSDLSNILRDLGLQPVTIPHLNTTNGTANRLPVSDCEKIEAYYRSDYEAFGY